MVLGKGNFPGVPPERSGDTVEMELFQILAKQVAKLGEDLQEVACLLEKLDAKIDNLDQVKTLEKTLS